MQASPAPAHTCEKRNYLPCSLNYKIDIFLNIAKEKSVTARGQLMFLWRNQGGQEDSAQSPRTFSSVSVTNSLILSTLNHIT